MAKSFHRSLGREGPIGLVAFSFGLSSHEPSRCNTRLSRAVRRIVNNEKGEVIVVVQWEIALSLASLSITNVVERHRRKDIYLDSDEVMAQAAKVFREHGITRVIPVANQFLHLRKCRDLVIKAGFVPEMREFMKIGFYKESLQWWTRGPLRLLFYAVLQKLTGRRGK